MKPIIFIITGVAIGFFASNVTSNSVLEIPNKNNQSPNEESFVEAGFISSITDNLIRRDAKNSNYSPFQNSLNGGAQKISALEASELHENYNKSSLQKLKAIDGQGEISDLQTIIIDRNTIDNLVEAIEKEPKKTRREYLGIALTPAVKQVSVNGEVREGHTFIITALVTETMGKTASKDDGVIHFLPDDVNVKTLIYDHIDICPNDCPTNQHQIESGKWTLN